MTKILTETRNDIFIVTINRSEARNAVDGETAALLADAFRAFDADASLNVAILTGADGNFCAGADLKAVGQGKGNRVASDGDGPMGPSRMQTKKPVIAAVEGYAVAGGLELACWCDMRVAARDATFGVFCRRWGVPLIDGGTVRLPRIVGHGHAMDMILTGRPVGAEEAQRMGLVNRIAQPGKALELALELAADIARFPQTCLRGDRESAIRQWSLSLEEALAVETQIGMGVIASGETLKGAQTFASGKGRHGDFGK